MKRNNNKELIEKFWVGETNLDEEKSLFSADQSDWKEADRAYFRFLAHARNSDFTGESEIWNSIVAREHRRKKMIYLSSGIAASILLLVSLFIVTSNISKYKKFENQIAFNNINDFYNAYKIDKSFNRSSQKAFQIVFHPVLRGEDVDKDISQIDSYPDSAFVNV
mgnify:CR=1 FL=1